MGTCKKGYEGKGVLLRVKLVKALPFFSAYEVWRGGASSLFCYASLRRARGSLRLWPFSWDWQMLRWNSCWETLNLESSGQCSLFYVNCFMWSVVSFLWEELLFWTLCVYLLFSPDCSSQQGFGIWKWIPRTLERNYPHNFSWCHLSQVSSARLQKHLEILMSCLALQVIG